ncbi:polysaccharide biosynthesis tyrosine autokinase [Paucibacter sp. Y2R2-4]|uniref:polysaccharide biosynthesis tyrosine autokinase n=1 Tax=Paucibacter sp. Y2R2-4 TaxID=2893553 RepID=UPI0021E365B4|nr:polysaccharide biosynthesis tyrosine autokinase [Paucibacter sp. Y2R2-4]MCV2349271.1 polysaccharide biosynthesis tyrosine autokinase [Paucibacter sp. Y2R2-4]
MASFENTMQDADDVSKESGTAPQERSIGLIIAEANNLSAEQVERVLAHQRTSGLKFGEAAIALGLVKGEDVVWALSQQFHYPYSASGSKQSNAELVMANQPFGEQAERFRVLRRQIIMRMFSGEAPKRAVAVVSPDSGDGKTFFAANLAIAFSQLGGRTLLVDADMRSPRLHEIFGINNSSGLSGILAGRPESNVIHPLADLPSLFVMPVGTQPPNPTELLERPAFGLLMQELVNKFDYVIVDTPAASFGADFAVIAARCGAALALARKDKTSVDALKDMSAVLNNTPGSLVGVVMNEH